MADIDNQVADILDGTDIPHMKHVSDGIRYDTEKSELIGFASPLGLSQRDYSYWKAALCKTPRSGRFFLAGYGGPMTRFARKSGNTGRDGGSGIIPMDEGEALAWAEEHLEHDQVVNYFAHLITDA